MPLFLFPQKASCPPYRYQVSSSNFFIANEAAYDKVRIHTIVFRSEIDLFNTKISNEPSCYSGNQVSPINIGKVPIYVNLM